MTVRFHLFRLVSASLLIASVSACATFPELDATITDAARAAPEPELIDNDSIVEMALQSDISLTTQEDLQGRAAALKSQGATLQGPVIAPSEREALEADQIRLREEAARVAPGT